MSCFADRFGGSVVGFMHIIFFISAIVPISAGFRAVTMVDGSPRAFRFGNFRGTIFWCTFRVFGFVLGISRFDLATGPAVVESSEEQLCWVFEGLCAKGSRCR